MRRSLLVLLCAASGCGDSGTGNPSNDLAVGSDFASPPGSDLVMAGDDQGVDLAAPPDLTMVVSGKKVGDGALTPLGVTADGWVVVIDDNTLDVSVVNLAGGAAPVKIASNGDSSGVLIAGKVVFVWHDLDMNTGDGPLAVWSQAAGVKDLSTLSARGFAAASTDGTLIGYTDNEQGMNGDFADLVIDKADHGAAKVLAKQIALLDMNCPPILQFAGSRLVATHCAGGAGPGGGGGNGGGSSSGGRPNATDGGASDGGRSDGGVPIVDAGPPIADAGPLSDGGMPNLGVVVTSWDASGAGIDLLTMAQPYLAVDPTGAFVVVVDGSGTGAIVPPNSKTPIVGGLAEFSSGAFVKDGSALVYATSSHAMRRVSTKAGSVPVTLQDRKVSDLVGLSPDGKWVIYYDQADGNTGFTDLFLAAATQPSPPVTLVGMTTGQSGSGPLSGVQFGDSFSDDSAFALYYPDADSVSLLGTATVVATAGGMPKVLGPSSAWIWAAGGGKVAYSANLVAVMGAGQRGDIFVGDLKAGVPSLLVTQAELNFFVSADRKTIVYSYRGDPNKAGLYAAPVP